MNKLQQILASVKSCMPGPKQLFTGLLIVASVYSLGLIFGHGLGAGLSKTYQAVVVHIEDGE